MNINTESETAARTVGIGFFIIMSVMEILIMCSIFSAFLDHWIKLASIIVTVTTFNIATWYFAIKYHRTQKHINDK